MRPFNILAACVLMAASVAGAAFVHPFVTPGEVYTNTMLLDLQYARAERTAVANRSSGSVGLRSYTVMVGTTQTVSVVTNGPWIVTNRLDYPVYATTNLSGAAALLPFVFGGVTSVPHVVRSMLLETQGGLDYWGYEVGGDDSGLWQTEFFAQHWQASNGLFDVWFGTPGADGTNPVTFPKIANPAVILSYTNIGWYTNAQTDTYGTITNSAWYFTRTPDVTQNWNLAEAYFVPDLWATNFYLNYGDGRYTWNSVRDAWTQEYGGGYLQIESVLTNGATKHVMSDHTTGFDEEYYIGLIGQTNWTSLPYSVGVGITNPTDSVVYYTNNVALAYREQAPMDYNHKDGLTPTMIFTPGTTNPYTPVTLVITGHVFSAFSATNNPDFGAFPNQEIITNATETITMSTTNPVSLTLSWRRITGISSTNTAGYRGDTWSIVYDDTFPLYGGATWTLTANDLNERRSFVDCLRWSYDDRKNVEPDPALDAMGSTGYIWTASSTSSWADAKTLCAATNPTTFLNADNGHPAQQWTSGEYDGFTWTARATSTKAKRHVKGVFGTMPTNYEHTIDLYVLAANAMNARTGLEFTNGVHTFDPFGDAWIQDTNQFWGYPSAYVGYTNEAYIGTTNTDAGWIGSTNFPPTWCDEPGNGDPRSRGYIIRSGPKTLAIIKWDSTTNGFSYIRE